MSKFVKALKGGLGWFGRILLGSACLVITGIIGEAYFGWAVFPGSEGHVPIFKFILLLLVVSFVLIGPFVALKAIWSVWKERKLERKLYVKRLEDTIDMVYTIVYSTPDECVKEALKDVFRYQGVGQNNPENPSSQNKVFFTPVIDVLHDSPDSDASDKMSRESSSDPGPDS